MINWFTVAAQIINFLVLLALLRIFLYKRIIEAMDAREAKIASRLREGEEKKKEAEEEADKFRRKQREQDEQRQAFLQDARKEADEQRKQLVSEYRQEAEEAREQWKQNLRSQKQQFLDELRTRACHELCAVSRRILGDLANAELEDAVVSVFVERVKDTEEVTAVLDGQGESGEEGVTVYSAFELSEGQREQVKKAVGEAAEREVAFDFEEDEGLICGLELRAGGRALGWNVDEYLQRLERRFMESFEAVEEARDKPEEEGEAEGRGEGEANEQEGSEEPGDG